jgi:tripartite-type tricarboxylate transporter receptor subunit TctC
MTTKTGLLLCVALLAALRSAEVFAAEENVEAFYKGKTISLHIGFGVGGGYDSYGRLAARHLGRHLPGAPAIVPKNQSAAGSILLANQLYNSLPKDGTAIGIISNSLPLEQLLGSSQMLFDASKFNWIGRLDDLSLLLLAWRTSGIATADDVVNKEFTIAVPGKGSTGNFSLGAIRKLLGAKYKLISGYRSGQETKLAMERGEVDATASVQWSTVKVANRDWIEQGKINLLVQLGLDKAPDLPNVPLAPELAKTDEQRRIIELLMLPAAIGRAIVAPPDVPAARLAALRQAFDDMLADPDFIADAARANLPINSLRAAMLQDVSGRIGKIAPDLLEQARAVTRSP